jgi:hypothetical protein
LIKINTTANTQIAVCGEPIKEVESFVYKGSVIDKQGAQKQRQQSKDWQGKRGFCDVEESMNFQTIQHKDKNLYLELHC